MRADIKRAADIPVSTMAALMLAAFTVSVGFGVVLPLLSSLIERLLGAGVEPAQASRHTGLLIAAYTLSLFLVPQAFDFMPMLAVIGAVAASAGVLSPILTYWISGKAGSAGLGTRQAPRSRQLRGVALACSPYCRLASGANLIARANRQSQFRPGRWRRTPRGALRSGCLSAKSLF